MAALSVSLSVECFQDLDCIWDVGARNILQIQVPMSMVCSIVAAADYLQCDSQTTFLSLCHFYKIIFLLKAFFIA